MKPSRLELDFLHPGRGGRSALPAWSLALLAAGVLAAGLEVALLVDTNAGVTRLEDQSGRLRRLAAGAARSAGTPGAERREELRGQLGRGWDRLLSDLEGAGGEDVALLSLEADGARAGLRLSGEARSLAEVMAYIERLGAGTSLSQVQLLSQENRQVDGQPVTAFTIEARWGRDR